MTPPYPCIQPIALKPDNDFLSHQQSYYIMGFPEEWKEPVLHLQRSAIKRSRDQAVSIPIRSLNAIIRSVISPRVITLKGAGDRGNDKWLISKHCYNTEAILQAIHTWASHEFRGAASLEVTLDTMTVEHLQWKPLDIPSLDWGVLANGTADVKGRDGYPLIDLLASIVADHLTQNDILFPFGNQSLQYYPCMPGTDNFQMEMIAWPPQMHGRSSPYSPLMQWKVVQRPWYPKPLLVCNYGIRRWIGSSRQVPRGNSTIYLRPRGSMLADTHFIPAQIRWEKQGNSFSLKWTDTELGMLIQSYITDPAFSLDALNEVPQDWIQQNPARTLDAAIVYNQTNTRENTKYKHWVTPGMLPLDRRELVDTLCELLPGFELVDTAERTRRSGIKAGSNPFHSLRSLDQESEQKRVSQALVQQECRVTTAKFVPANTVVFEIYYQSLHMKDHLTNAIAGVFGRSEPQEWQPLSSAASTQQSLGQQQPDTEYHYLTPELTVILRCCRQSTLLSLLADDDASGIRRASEIRDTVHPLPESVPYAVAFVELQNWRGEENDPKVAIRQGFAYANRLTQFVSLYTADESEGTLAERLKSAVLDGLRQLGCYAKLPSHNHHQDLYYIGVHLLRALDDRSKKRSRNSFIPTILVIPATGDSVPRVHFPNLTLSYSEALLRLATDPGIPRYDQQQCLAFIQDKLSTMAADQHVIALVDTVRTRTAWTSIQDGRLEPDILFLEPRLEVTQLPTLRVARLRQGEEVPEWYAVQEDEVSLSTGLFRTTDCPLKRTFYSIAPKPPMQRGVSTKARKSEDPSAQTYTPGLQEIVIFACQKDDDPATLAELVHKLRKSNITTKDGVYTTYPMPIHYAEKMEEYLIF